MTYALPAAFIDTVPQTVGTEIEKVKKVVDVALEAERKAQQSAVESLSEIYNFIAGMKNSDLEALLGNISISANAKNEAHAKIVRMFTASEAMKDAETGAYSFEVDSPQNANKWTKVLALASLDSVKKGGFIDWLQTNYDGAISKAVADAGRLPNETKTDENLLDKYQEAILVAEGKHETVTIDLPKLSAFEGKEHGVFNIKAVIENGGLRIITAKEDKIDAFINANQISAANTFDSALKRVLVTYRPKIYKKESSVVIAVKDGKLFFALRGESIDYTIHFKCPHDLNNGVFELDCNAADDLRYLLNNVKGTLSVTATKNSITFSYTINENKDYVDYSSYQSYLRTTSVNNAVKKGKKVGDVDPKKIVLFAKYEDGKNTVKSKFATIEKTDRGSSNKTVSVIANVIDVDVDNYTTVENDLEGFAVINTINHNKCKTLIDFLKTVTDKECKVKLTNNKLTIGLNAVDVDSSGTAEITVTTKLFLNALKAMRTREFKVGIATNSIVIETAGKQENIAVEIRK